MSKKNQVKKLAWELVKLIKDARFQISGQFKSGGWKLKVGKDMYRFYCFFDEVHFQPLYAGGVDYHIEFKNRHRQDTKFPAFDFLLELNRMLKKYYLLEDFPKKRPSLKDFNDLADKYLAGEDTYPFDEHTTTKLSLDKKQKIENLFRGQPPERRTKIEISKLDE